MLHLKVVFAAVLLASLTAAQAAVEYNAAADPNNHIEIPIYDETGRQIRVANAIIDHHAGVGALVPVNERWTDTEHDPDNHQYIPHPTLNEGEKWEERDGGQAEHWGPQDLAIFNHDFIEKQDTKADAVDKKLVGRIVRLKELRALMEKIAQIHLDMDDKFSFSNRDISKVAEHLYKSFDEEDRKKIIEEFAAIGIDYESLVTDKPVKLNNDVEPPTGIYFADNDDDEIPGTYEEYGYDMFDDVLARYMGIGPIELAYQRDYLGRHVHRKLQPGETPKPKRLRKPYMNKLSHQRRPVMDSHDIRMDPADDGKIYHPYRNPEYNRHAENGYPFANLDFLDYKAKIPEQFLGPYGPKGIDINNVDVNNYDPYGGRTPSDDDRCGGDSFQHCHRDNSGPCCRILDHRCGSTYDHCRVDHCVPRFGWCIKPGSEQALVSYFEDQVRNGGLRIWRPPAFNATRVTTSKYNIAYAAKPGEDERDPNEPDDPATPRREDDFSEDYLG